MKTNYQKLVSVFFILFALLVINDIINSGLLFNHKQTPLPVQEKKQEQSHLLLIATDNENEKKLFLASIQACEKLAPNIPDCYQDLMAMARKEDATFNLTTEGNDSYSSHGPFQISRYYHPEITIDQATDPFFSAEWTLNNLISNGYLKNRSIAIMKHNGTPNTWRTKDYLKKVNLFKDDIKDQIKVLVYNK